MENNKHLTSPYDYSNRSGIRLISWNDFHGLVKALAVAVAPWKPEFILPVGRGGFYPGTLLAHILQVEIFPIRVTRREDDVVVREEPIWIVEPPAIIARHRVLVVDEISSTGRTLEIVRKRATAVGAGEVRSAVLYAHTWGVDVPDYIGLVTDDLVLNPWDRELYREGNFMFHPEYQQSLAQQGVTVDQSLLIAATPFTVHKKPNSS